jgi:hypothetical protein
MSFGGPEETRTPYLCNANAALYQMSYWPMEFLTIALYRSSPQVNIGESAGGRNSVRQACQVRSFNIFEVWLRQAYQMSYWPMSYSVTNNSTAPEDATTSTTTPTTLYPSKHSVESRGDSAPSGSC